MEYKLAINCDNAAFEGDQLAREIALLLRLAADDIERDNYAGRVAYELILHDTNGNWVGMAEVVG